MGAILDHGDPMRITQGHQRVHIANMPAHMGQQQNRRLIYFGRQIIKIDHQILGHLDIDRAGPNGGNRAGHRRKGKGVGQNRIALPYTAGPKGRCH